MENIAHACKRTADISDDTAKSPNKIAVERRELGSNDIACGEVVFDIDALPMEMLCRILGSLTLPEMLILATVSRRWRRAVDVCLTGRRSFNGELLFGTKRVTNKLLEKVLSRMPGLYKFEGIQGTNLDINILSRRCPHLVTADLAYFRMDESSLKRFCTSCPKLTTLVLPNSCDFACVETVLRGLPGLRSLEIYILDSRNKFLEVPSADLQHLEMWDPSRCEQMEQLARCPTALTNLGVSYMSPSCVGMVKLLQMCPGLETLHARDSHELTDRFLYQLAIKAPNIRELDIQGCDGFTANGLKHLGQLKELRKLNIYITGATEAVLDRLQGAPHLTELIVGKSWCQKSDFSMESLARLVISCPSLKVVVPSELDDMKVLVKSMIGRLSPDRDVTVLMGEGDANKLRGRLPEDGPLRAIPNPYHGFQWHT